MSEPAVDTSANVPVEIAADCTRSRPDPFNTMEVDAVMTTPSGRRWKARYAHGEVAGHTYRLQCSAPRPAGPLAPPAAFSIAIITPLTYAGMRTAIMKMSGAVSGTLARAKCTGTGFAFPARHGNIPAMRSSA